MSQSKLISYILKIIGAAKSYGEKHCVFDYIWSQVRGKGDFQTYDYEKLSNELLHYGFFKIFQKCQLRRK